MAITFLTNEDGQGFDDRLKALEESQGSEENPPYIGENGNWFVNGEDTGVSATGAGIEDITIKEV